MEHGMKVNYNGAFEAVIRQQWQDLSDEERHDAERLLFTFSYVSHQNAVTPAHIDQWATHIERAVSEVGEGVELIYTTIDLVGGPVRWNIQDELWDVEAQHWTLRA